MTVQPVQHTEVRTERVFPAPADRVYRAWLDPELVRQWLAPGTQEVIRDAKIIERIPDQRLVFRWGFIGPERRQGPYFDTLLTVSFHPEPSGGTTVRLTHEHLDELAAAMPEIAANVGTGWEAVLDKLASVLDGDTPCSAAEALATELNDPCAQQLLATQPLARLAYTGPDGFPRVIPIGFYWDGNQIIVCTAPSSPKVRALSARPHVALTIDTDDGPASRALFVRGVAAIDIVDGVPGEYLAAATKTMDTQQARQFEANVRMIYKQMARITVQPRWARYYDFGAGRIPAFLHKLVAGNSASES
jgi:uncharacterized protein YndB with AHSA1/START domain